MCAVAGVGTVAVAGGPGSGRLPGRPVPGVVAMAVPGVLVMAVPGVVVVVGPGVLAASVVLAVAVVTSVVVTAAVAVRPVGGSLPRRPVSHGPPHPSLALLMSTGRRPPGISVGGGPGYG